MAARELPEPRLKMTPRENFWESDDPDPAHRSVLTLREKVSGLRAFTGLRENNSSSCGRASMPLRSCGVQSCSGGMPASPSPPPAKKLGSIGFFGNTGTQNPRPGPHEKSGTRSRRIRDSHFRICVNRVPQTKIPRSRRYQSDMRAKRRQRRSHGENSQL